MKRSIYENIEKVIEFAKSNKSTFFTDYSITKLLYDWRKSALPNEPEYSLRHEFFVQSDSISAIGDSLTKRLEETCK